MSAVRAIPEGYHSVTPALVCKNAAKAIDYYKEVFQAKELGRMTGPGGAIGHAENLLGILLDQDRRQAFLADDALERG